MVAILVAGTVFAAPARSLTRKTCSEGHQNGGHSDNDDNLTAVVTYHWGSDSPLPGAIGLLLGALAIRLCRTEAALER